MCSYFPMHDIVLSNWSNWPQSSSSNRLSAQKTLFSIHKHTAGATYADQIDFQTAIDSPSYNRTRIVCKSGFLQDKLRVLCLYIISDPKIFKWMRHMDWNRYDWNPPTDLWILAKQAWRCFVLTLCLSTRSSSGCSIIAPYELKQIRLESSRDEIRLQPSELRSLKWMTPTF